MTETTEAAGREVTVTFMLNKSTSEAEVRNEIKQNLTDTPEGWEITRISMGDQNYDSLDAFHQGS